MKGRERLFRLGSVTLALAVSCPAQNLSEVLKRGQQVFAKSCATGYCHGVKGGPSGAPRLAGRGFDQTYINKAVTSGVANTGMPSFGTRLSPADLVAVVAYVSTLNGIAEPSAGDSLATESPGSALTGEAARGAQLFRDAVRGFGRCSTCHEIDGLGIPIAAPMLKVPVSTAALKALATPNVKTGTIGDESMPVLVLSESKFGAVFYDLTSAPPVQRTVGPGQVKFTEGGNWRHSSVLAAYNDNDLSAIVTYLRAVIQP